MLLSVSSLANLVREPLQKVYGRGFKLLSIGLHGSDIKGLALIPSKVVSFVFVAKTKEFRSSAVLSVVDEVCLLDNSQNSAQ